MSDFNINNYKKITTDEEKIISVSDDVYVNQNGDFMTGALHLPELRLYGFNSSITFSDGTTQLSAPTIFDPNTIYSSNNTFEGTNIFNDILTINKNMCIQDVISGKSSTIIQTGNNLNINAPSGLVNINKISTNELNIGSSTLDDYIANVINNPIDLTNIQNSITNLENSKQDKINSLPYFLLDISGSPLEYLDISGSLSTSLSALENQITTNNNNVLSVLANHTDNLATNNNNIGSIFPRLQSVENRATDTETQITIINQSIDNQAIINNNVSSVLSAHTTNLAANNNNIGSIFPRLITVENKTIDNQNQITTNNNTLQSQITTNNNNQITTNNSLQSQITTNTNNVGVIFPRLQTVENKTNNIQTVENKTTITGDIINSSLETNSPIITPQLTPDITTNGSGTYFKIGSFLYTNRENSIISFNISRALKKNTTGTTTIYEAGIFIQIKSNNTIVYTSSKISQSPLKAFTLYGTSTSNLIGSPITLDVGFSTQDYEKTYDLFVSASYSTDIAGQIPINPSTYTLSYNLSAYPSILNADIINPTITQKGIIKTNKIFTNSINSQNIIADAINSQNITTPIISNSTSSIQLSNSGIQFNTASFFMPSFSPGIYLLSGGGGNYFSAPIFYSCPNCNDILNQLTNGATVNTSQISGGTGIGTYVFLEYNDDDDVWLVLPKYGIIAYDNFNYSGEIRLNFKNTTLKPITVRPNTTNRVSSYKIYYNDIEILS